ncbi:hypothetical protein LP420_23340 [Massilia sp. B-10]|nr:hypothetical protein LP420_23340 [Massilia sp. B-10]
MIELYHHQHLWDARQTQRVYDAFVDVWGTEQLWVTIDRMNFNLPPAPGFAFKSFMHWDYDPDSDPQNVQGVLAVSDQRDPAVGGFVCIPELFRHYDAWRAQQGTQWDWYRPDVAKPAARAGPAEQGRPADLSQQAVSRHPAEPLARPGAPGAVYCDDA